MARDFLSKTNHNIAEFVSHEMRCQLLPQDGWTFQGLKALFDCHSAIRSRFHFPTGSSATWAQSCYMCREAPADIKKKKLGMMYA